MRVVIMGVVGVSRCRCGRCHFQILPCSPLDLTVPSPFAFDSRESPGFARPGSYCAAAPAEANEFAGLVANFFFAVSIQAANS